MVLIALPFALFGFMLNAKPDYIEPLWTTDLGRKMSIAAIIAQDFQRFTANLTRLRSGDTFSPRVTALRQELAGLQPGDTALLDGFGGQGCGQLDHRTAGKPQTVVGVKAGDAHQTFGHV